MSALSRTRRIAPKEWEDRKNQILELYLNRRLQLSGSEGVIETMVKEGFAATVSQYEHRFRLWGVHKNMKRDDWVKYFKNKRQGAGTTQIELPVREISESRIKKAQYRYAPRRLQAGDSAPSQSSNAAQRNAASPIPGHISIEDPGFDAIISTTNFDNEVGNGAASADLDANLFGDLPVLELVDEPIDLNLFNFGLDHVYFPVQEENEPIQTLPFAGNDPSHEELTAFNFSPGDVMNIVHSTPPASTSLMMGEWPIQPSLSDAAYADRRISSRSQWSSQLPSAKIVALVIEDILRNTCPTSARGTMQTRTPFGLARRFMATMNETMAKSRAYAHGTHITFPRALEDLLSSGDLFGEDQSQFSRLPNSIDLEARFYSRLFVSATNGFAGLGSIPPAAVLRSLYGHEIIQISMAQFLCSGTAPVVRSLAENVFRAAVEADNAEVVEYLLDRPGLIDVNKTMCHYHIGRCTPLEMATLHRSFRVVRLLMNKKADVNKPFPRRHYPKLLGILVEHRYADYEESRKSTLSDDYLNVVGILLEKTTTIPESCIMDALNYVDSRLVARLIEKSALRTLQTLFLDGNLLRTVITTFDRQDATSIIELIISKHQESGDEQYLYRFPKQIDDALDKAAQRGYERLVGILSPYASSPGKTFLAVSKTRNQAMIDEVLKENPDLESSTLFMAALRAGDENRLRSLEERGLLDCLHDSHVLGQALLVALEGGNLGFANKILDINPEFDYDLDSDDFDPGAALDAALTHGFDDIAWKLLDIATISDSGPFHQKLIPSLYVAVTKRRTDFVKAIMEYGFSDHELRGYYDHEPRSYYSNDPPLIEVAIEWGDESTLDDLWRACPSGMSPPDSLLKLIIEKKRLGMLRDLLKDPNRMGYLLQNALRIAVECENIPLLDELITLGAKADDGEALRIAVMNRPSMVKPLLERYRTAYPGGRPGYGRSAIEEAIRYNYECPQWLDMCFDYGLVTQTVFQGYETRETLLRTAFTSGKRDRPVRHPDIRLIERLINAGCGVNCTMGSYYGKTTPLLEAIKVESVEILWFLIEKGANVNEPARFGIRRTPLQEAAEINNREIVDILLEKGADVNAAPARFFGATALQFAAIYGNCEMVTLLIERGAWLHAPPPQGIRGRWPLEGAAEYGRLDMIRLLWNINGGPFDDEQCRKAMRRAERNGHLGCRDLIKELMAKDAWRATNTALAGI